MSEFTLDMPGYVQIEAPYTLEVIRLRFRDLSPFEQGYVEAMKNDRRMLSYFDDARMLDWHDWAFSDLAPETLSVIRRDCAALVSPPYVFASGAEAGRFCWEWRQRGWRNTSGGPTLRETFPPLTIYLGDDGLVCFKETSA